MESYGLSDSIKHHMSNKLFVGNLSFNVTENDLNDAFAAFGTVTETNLMMDRTTAVPAVSVSSPWPPRRKLKRPSKP